MYKSCSRCGKIHASNYQCNIGRVARKHNGGTERTLRSSWKWTEKSKEIRDKAHYMCEVCMSEGRINLSDVEVHHIIKVKDNEDLLLDNFNLICLCTTHHHQADSGELSQDLLQDLARQREMKK